MADEAPRWRDVIGGIATCCEPGDSGLRVFYAAVALLENPDGTVSQLWDDPGFGWSVDNLTDDELRRAIPPMSRLRRAWDGDDERHDRAEDVWRALEIRSRARDHGFPLRAWDGLAPPETEPEPTGEEWKDG